MNLHKDKERLRHQKQVRLLDDVMKIVPRPLSNSPSKVRKLRHLVLYYHFMQKVHAQIIKDHQNIIKSNKKSVKKEPMKSEDKHLMILSEQKKKFPRANIVFLQADRSENEEKNISGETFIKNDDYLQSSHLEKMEYKMPEIVAVNSVNVKNVAFDHNFCLPAENMQNHSNCSSSTGELSLQSDLISEEYYKEGKRNHSPISNFSTMNSSNNCNEEQPVSSHKRKVSESVIINDNLNHGKHRKTDFQNILQDYSNNSTLRDLTTPNATNENFYVANINYPVHYSNYVFETYPIENVILASNELNCEPLYNSNETESQVHNSPENLSDNYSDGTLTDNLHIDVENFSDSSSEISKMKSNSSDNLNVCDSPRVLAYDFPHDTLMNYDELVLPFVSSSYNYLENYYSTQNEISYKPIGYLPHFESIPCNNVIFNENSSLIQCFEPVHPFQDRLIEPRFVNDNVSFYSPSFEIFPSGNLTLLNSKSGTRKPKKLDSQVLFGDNNPGLPDEEASYPISQYINN